MLSTFAMKFWPKDWEQDVYQRLKALGHSSVRDFLQANPLLGYTALAKTVGEKTVPFMLGFLQYREAIEVGELCLAAMDSFSRKYRECNPGGWKAKSHADNIADFASATGLLAAELAAIDPRLEGTMASIFNDICDRDPPAGWTPTGATDPVLLAAFDKCWPADRP